MPILTKHQIVRITDVMLQAGGAPAGHAGIVADHLAQANLAGYDSHGFIRLPQYLKEIEEGLFYLFHKLIQAVCFLEKQTNTSSSLCSSTFSKTNAQYKGLDI